MKTALFAAILVQSPERGDDAMEQKYPNVQFILEALVGFVVITAKGDHLLKDQDFEPRKANKWPVASPTYSKLSEIRQATAYVFSDSVLYSRRDSRRPRRQQNVQAKDRQ